MYIDVDTIIKFGEIFTALVGICGGLFAMFKWLQKQRQQDIDIKALKAETCILTYGLLACLKGMKEHGYNGPVTDAIEKLEKHMNKKAHDQE